MAHALRFSDDSTQLLDSLPLIRALAVVVGCKCYCICKLLTSVLIATATEDSSRVAHTGRKDM